VVWVCGGLGIAGSIVRLIQHPSSPIQFTTPRLLGTVGGEVGLAIAFLPFLRGRGWRLTDATLPFQFRDVLRGLGLLVATYVLYALTATIAPISLFITVGFRGSIPLWVVAIVSLINPIFEEFFYLGYTFSALRRYSAPLAFAVAVGLRVAIHLYQGWLALVFIAPLAVVYTLYFRRTNRIWPVIVAHAIQDFVALAFLKPM